MGPWDQATSKHNEASTLRRGAYAALSAKGWLYDGECNSSYNEAVAHVYKRDEPNNISNINCVFFLRAPVALIPD